MHSDETPRLSLGGGDDWTYALPCQEALRHRLSDEDLDLLHWGRLLPQIRTDRLLRIPVLLAWHPESQYTLTG